jgi:hypothetical protein
MSWLAMVVWWAAGTSSMLWLQRGNNITWGRLVGCLLLGLLGPALWLIIGFVILIQADFWSKPIFPKRCEHEQKERNVTCL